MYRLNHKTTREKTKTTSQTSSTTIRSILSTSTILGATTNRPILTKRTFQSLDGAIQVQAAWPFLADILPRYHSTTNKAHTHSKTPRPIQWWTALQPC